MEDKIKKDLFDMFQKEKDSFRLYEKIIGYMQEAINDTKGKENAYFYEVLRTLSNSMNNAGWEERHSQHIEILFNESNKISNKYERFLS